MKLLRGRQSATEFAQGTVATIGNFDGVHLGHQSLLQELLKVAKTKMLPAVVVLFEPQPSEYFQGASAPVRLSSLREKLEILRQMGVDYVYCLKFDESLSEMPAVAFANEIIFSLLNVKHLLIGQDFRFGRKREGDIELLKSLSLSHHCQVDSYADFLIGDERVSSTKIRQILKASQLKQAALLLGRPYSLCGRVIKGAGLGRQWGIPTANIHLQRDKLPLTGVFCVKVKRHGFPLMTGVANLGSRPTVDGKKIILEVNLFDFQGSIYGEMLNIFFLHKLRDEQKFANLHDLIAQIHKDVAEAKIYFSTLQ